MEYVFAIMTGTFGFGLLLYALILSRGNYENILKNWTTNPPDKEKYTKEFAKIIALIALAPIISGVVSLVVKSTVICVIILAVLMILFIIIGVQHMKKYL